MIGVRIKILRQLARNTKSRGMYNFVVDNARKWLKTVVKCGQLRADRYEMYIFED